MSDHVLSGLQAKRAELAGKVDHLAKELEQARRDLGYLDGALHVFGYGDDPAAIKSKRYRPTPRLFSRGELQRTIFDQLRSSPDGIETPEITARIMRQKGWDTTDSDLRSSVTRQRLPSTLKLMSALMERLGLVGKIPQW